jgi:hypothetical protein
VTERLTEPEPELEPETSHGPVGARFPSAKAAKRRTKSEPRRPGSTGADSTGPDSTGTDSTQPSRAGSGSANVGPNDPATVEPASARSDPDEPGSAGPETDRPVHGPTGARFPAPQLADRLSGEPEPEAVKRVRAKFASAELAERMAEVPEPDHSTVGRAGARFPSPKVADRLTGETEKGGDPNADRSAWADPTDSSGETSEPDRTDAAHSGTLGEDIVQPHSVAESAQPTAGFTPAPDFTPASGHWDDWAEESPSQPGPRTLVRPYVLTRGRTQSRRHLAIEALVSTCAEDAQWENPQMSGEFRSVRTMCHYPRSVAEVAATLSVPLGVARILLDDMAELGLVRIHENQGASDGRPALALMERVLSGLHRL